MTKTYSVPKNRWLAILLLNTPYPPEPREPSQETPKQSNERMRNAMTYIAAMSVFADQFYVGRS